MNSIKVIDDWLEKICRFVIVILFLVIIVSAFIQVFWRYVLNSPLTWSDELCRFGMIWLTFFAAGLGVKKYTHISIDLLKGYLPLSVNKVIERFNSLLIIIFSLIIVYYGAIIAAQNITQKSPGLNLSMGFVYAIVPVGGLIMLFYATLQLLQLQKEL